MDGAEVGDLGDPQELLRRALPQLGEHGGHGDVDPDVDLAELLLDLRARRPRAASASATSAGATQARRPGLAHLGGGGLEPDAAAGDQADVVAAGGELAHAGAADAGGALR